MRDEAISKLVTYALRTGLIREEERTWAVNALLETLKLDEYTDPGQEWGEIDLPAVLDELLDDAAERGVLAENTAARRDLLDSALMGRLTPRPGQVIDRFRALYADSPEKATDWFYRFSQDTNYIRRDRLARDVRWETPTRYGVLEMTINLSKPEKDPRDIAAAAQKAPSNYPSCPLCPENEGYAGRLDHPARQNHRIVPVKLRGEEWYLQYSPYVYYNEHCICLSREHRPMKTDRACFERLLDFVEQFPHYFMGANADLPIVGGSILSHDHFQGGRHTFPMERAPVERAAVIPGFEDVNTGIVKWPLSVLRIGSADRERLAALAEHILNAWRDYSDESLSILARGGETPHNTVTAIARRRGKRYELDLVLRNNRTTPEHPLGLFHPHEELHHIKKENIGLIEVMGLAVLPARLRGELTAVARALCEGRDLRADECTAPHADWAEKLKAQYRFDRENVLPILQRETALVFVRVL